MTGAQLPEFAVYKLYMTMRYILLNRYALTVSALLIASGCASNPNLQVNKLDQSTSIIQYNQGPFIKKVDLDKVMRDNCESQEAQIIREESMQLPGQYRFQKQIEFKCVEPGQKE